MLQARLRNRKQSSLRIGSVRRMNSPNGARGVLFGGGGPAAPENRGTTRRSLARTCCLRRWRMVRQYVAGDIMLNLGPRKSTAHSILHANVEITPSLHIRSSHASQRGTPQKVPADKPDGPHYEAPRLGVHAAFLGLLALQTRKSHKRPSDKSSTGHQCRQ